MSKIFLSLALIILPCLAVSVPTITPPVSPSLQKSMTTAAMTTYTNYTFNFAYTSPSGWSFPTPSVYSDGVLITASNPNYPATITITVFSRQTSIDAADFAKAQCFQMVSYAYNASTLAPILPSVIDTFYSNTAFGQAWVKVKYGINESYLGAVYNRYTSNYVIMVYYWTTVSDHDLNDNIYFNNVLNAQFIKLGPSITLSKSVTAAPIQNKVDLALYDLIGRKMAIGSPEARQTPNFYIQQYKDHGATAKVLPKR